MIAAFALAVVGMLGGLAAPRVIAAIPEPVLDSSEAPKATYTSLAAARGLGVWLGALGALVGAAVGLRLGWHSSALPWVVMVPVGAVLAYVDLRVRLLPNRIVFPAYGAVLVSLGAGALLDWSPRVLVAAAIGWAILGGFYLAAWFVYPAGMGYGDVRLAGLLGLALGPAGLAAVIVGGWLGLFLGAIISLVLQRRTRRRLNAHGPGMLLGAYAGVLCGSALARALGY